MTGARDIAQMCFSSNLTGIVANKIEQSFYSVYSYSGIESIEHALKGKHLLLLGAGRRPSQGFASAFFVIISCALNFLNFARLQNLNSD